LTTTPEEESNEIRNRAKKRGITRLIHFTQSRNLAHILFDPSGIRSSKDLQSNAADVFSPNDKQRLDGRPDYISCSIEYPNYWMLRRAKDRETFFRDWSILMISPSALWQPGTLFSKRNAAAEGGRFLDEGADAFESLFAPSVLGARGITRRRPKQMLACSPTDDQAEVMIHNNIPLSMITGVIVPSIEKARVEVARLESLGSIPALSWIVAPEMFSDAASVAIRNGVRPKEISFKSQ
jgi:hypothetical protein